MLFRRLLIAIFVLTHMPGVSAQQYAFKEYGENDGLNSLTIDYLLQDRSGVLWVGSENGLYQFDGSTFGRVGAEGGIKETYITSLQQDAVGELWVGTSGALYHGNGHHFRAVPFSGVFLQGGGQLLSAGASGEMLAVSNSHLLRAIHPKDSGDWSLQPYFSAAQLAAQPELQAVKSVYTDRSGSLWMGCGQSICQVRGSSVKVWTQKEGVPSGEWCWFLEDSSGRVWTRSYRHILVLESGSTAFSNNDIPALDETVATPFLPMVEDARHHIVTRTNQGVAIWCKGKWHTIGAENGLRGPGILSMTVDASGALWLGTYGKGAELWRGYGNWETWQAGGGPEENPVVWSIGRDTRGTLWAATQSGMAVFDSIHNRFTRWSAAVNRPQTQIFSLIPSPDGTLWFTSADHTLYQADLRSGRSKQWNLPVQLRARQDSSGRVWGLSADGLTYYDDKTKRMVRVNDPVVAGRRFYDSCENSQGLWFASTSGLIHFADGRFSQVDASGKKAAEGFDGIACGADGSLWLGGTMTGANTGVTHVVFRNGVADAQEIPELASVETLFVRRDHRKWIWIGSGSGVYVFNGSRWVHISQKDGLAWDDCAEDAFFEDNDGSIWIGTSNGLSHLVHPESLFSPQPLKIMTLSASLGNAAIPLSGTPLFDWTREPLQVHLASSAITSQGSIVYRYRLGGLEDDWATSRSPEIHYSTLPDGKYHLYLYAEDPDHGLRSPMTEIAFRIRPPWWRGIPFRVAGGIALLALVYSLLRFRERSLRARQQHLEQLVRQRTAELEQEKQQLMDAREALREQASRDALTGLLNYGAIHDVLCRELARTEREGPSISAVMIDIDHFKSVNDQYGHMVGDEVLREVARRLTDSIRPYDTVGRYGGEEFLLIMPDFDALQDSSRLEAIHDAICVEPIPLSHGRVKITCSFGVSVMRENEIDGWEVFLDRADKALYRAKHSGRNRIAYDIPSISL